MTEEQLDVQRSSLSRVKNSGKILEKIKEFCHVHTISRNDNWEKQETLRKKAKEYTKKEAKKNDIRRFIKPGKCEENTKRSLFHVTTAYQLLFPAIDITVRWVWEQEETKNNPHETRETSRTIFATRGYTRLARMSFSNPMKSSAWIHIVRSFDPPYVEIPAALRRLFIFIFIFFLLPLWNEQTSLLPNIITRREIKKIVSPRRAEGVDCALPRPLSAERHIKLFL